MLHVICRRRNKLLVTGILIFSPLVHAQECEPINCDCDAIPRKKLAALCSMRESQLKSSCLETNKISRFCSVHGPAASPIAIVTQIPEVDLSDIDVNAENRKIATLYWSLRQDINYSEDAFKDGDLLRAYKILKITKRNLDNLFVSQHRAGGALAEREKSKKARSAWKNYLSDNESLAKHVNKYARAIVADLNKSAQISQVHYDLAFLILAFAGDVYEHTGFVAARADRHVRAARAWKSASKMSSEQLSLPVEGIASRVVIEDIQEIAAARLHRASYHWLKGDKEDDAEEVLRLSTEFVANQKLLDEILNEAPSDASGQ